MKFRHSPTLRSRHLSSLLSLSLLGIVGACSSDNNPFTDDETSTAGNEGATGGTNGSASGGAAASGGAPNSGGALSSGGAGTGGVTGTGSGGVLGSDNSGGVPNAGGSVQSESGGAPSGAGGMVTATFDPCPATGSCKILPLGDSITVGWGSTHGGSYRVELFHLAHAAGHDITFTGTQSPTGPNMVDYVTFPRKHEGIAGEKIAQIMARVDHALDTETPHIVIVHAGTNDMSMMPDGANARLEILVDKLISDLPDALIVVSNIVPFPQYASLVTTFNAELVPMLKERIDAGAHLIFVDQFGGFPTSELDDGVHPNDAGYARMADKWYEAIEDYL